VAAGVTLIMMTILYAVSKTERWTWFSYFRIAVSFLTGVTLCAVIASMTDPDDTIPERMEQFQMSPWPLPIICICFTFVLVLNNLPKTLPVWLRRLLPRRRKAGPSGGSSIGLGSRKLAKVVLTPITIKEKMAHRLGLDKSYKVDSDMESKRISIRG
jgi:hypothetical protein